MSTSPPRILVVNNTCSLPAGTTRSLLLILKHLRGRFSFGVAAPTYAEGLPAALRSQGIPFFPLGYSRLSPVTNVAGLMKVIARERYDLVYANNLGEVTRSAFWAARLTRRPFVWHIREPVRKKMAVLTVKYSDAVAANSSHTARAIISVTGYKTPVVIPNGVEPADFRTGRAEAREALLKELGWPEDSFLILNIGFLCERKNQIDAVEVIRLVTERHPEARLLCIGTPAGAGYDQRVRGRIDQGRLSDKVRLLGFRPSPAEYLLGADLLLHTSVNEPQGRVVLEAMAARLPVVAYRVGGIPEAVVECETGVLIPLGDTAAAAEATCLLIEDSERRLTMGQAGRDRVMRHFTAEATAHTVGGIIESVLSTRQKSRTRKRSS